MLLGSRIAAAQIQTRGPELYPSRHALTASLGYQAGFAGTVENPSGFKLTVDYTYRLHDLWWLDLEVANVFGGGKANGSCFNSAGEFCYGGGWGFDIAAGVKLAVPFSVPLVLEVPLLVGTTVLYNRNCGDNGAAAPLFKQGIRLFYFLTSKIGVGLGANVSLAPGFHSSGCANRSYTDLYGAFDFLAGATFIL